MPGSSKGPNSPVRPIGCRAPKSIVFLIESIGKMTGQAQELQISDINGFLNTINKEIDLSGTGAAEVQNQLFS